MNKQMVAMGLTLVLLAGVRQAVAAVPLSINYSGELVETTTGTEKELADKNAAIFVRLYASPTGTQPLWARQYPVILSKGKFYLEISETGGSEISGGTTSSLQEALRLQATDPQSEALYIGLRPFEDLPNMEIAPRQRVVSVPFAMLANDVTSARRNFAVTNGLVRVKNLTVLQDAVFSNQVTIAASQGTTTVQFASSPLFTVGISNSLVNSSATVSKSATVAGPVTFNGGLVVTSLTSAAAATLNNGLEVKGAAALNGGLTANGGLTVGAGGSTITATCLVPTNSITVSGLATVTNLCAMNASSVFPGSSIMDSVSGTYQYVSVTHTRSNSWFAVKDCFVCAGVVFYSSTASVRGKRISCKFYASPTAEVGTGTFLAEVGMGTSASAGAETGFYGTRFTSFILKSGEYLTFGTENAEVAVQLSWRAFNYSY